MIKRVLFSTIFFSSLIFSNDILLESLIKNNTSQSNLLPSKRWKLNTTITHHINPMLNSITESACITCGLDKALGLIGQIEYHTTKAFTIGLKATILNNQYKNSLTEESLLNNLELSSLTIVCSLSL